MSKKIVNGILAQYIGKKDEEIGNLSVYLDSPVGVGEHGNIGEIIREKLEEIDRLDSLIETVQKYFGNDSEDQTKQNSDDGNVNPDGGEG